MAPRFFKSHDELINFLQALPRPEGVARVQGADMEAEAILNRCVALVPQIFEYKKVLAKGQGGIGSQKAVQRYAELAAENVSLAQVEAYEAAVAQIEAEVSLLLEAGGGEGLGETLRAARTKVAMFQAMKNTIEGFKAKLHKHMQNVEATYGDLSAQLLKSKREVASVLGQESLTKLSAEIRQKHETVVGLVEAMDEYCALQVAYNAIMLAQ